MHHVWFHIQRTTYFFEWPWKQAHAPCLYWLASLLLLHLCSSCCVHPPPHTHLQPQTCCYCSACLKGTPLAERDLEKGKQIDPKTVNREEDRTSLADSLYSRLTTSSAKNPKKATLNENKNIRYCNYSTLSLKMCFCYLHKMSVSVRVLQEILLLN